MVNKRIGILGGGQLARMSAMQAIRMGIEVSILDKEEHSPAGQLTKNEFTGWVDDKKVLDEFIESADIITLENEFIDYKELEYIEAKGKKVIPGSKVISLIQDKLLQKLTLQQNGIAVPVFLGIDEEMQYKNVSGLLGKKFVLKSRKMGYDGYGNFLVSNESDYIEGYKRLAGRGEKLMAEKFVIFEAELAIMVVRTEKEIRTYPVVETVQKNHICHLVIAPAQIQKRFLKEAEEIAIECVKAIDGYGVFGIEMFLTKDRILVNEMAPRPHNSGHYTIEGCITSQFENHIRAVLSMPLGSTDMVGKYAVMVNLLGKKNDDKGIENYEKVLEDKEIHLHYYGKKLSRPGRKMGHVTIVGDDLERMKESAIKAEQKTII